MIARIETPLDSAQISQQLLRYNLWSPHVSFRLIIRQSSHVEPEIFEFDAKCLGPPYTATDYGHIMAATHAC